MRPASKSSRADAPNEFRPAAFRKKHAGQKKQVARLNSFHIGAERSGWHGELEGEFFQPLLGAFRRFRLTSSRPFDEALTSIKGAVGHPDMVEFVFFSRKEHRYANDRCLCRRRRIR